MKHITELPYKTAANLITGSRIAASLPLLFIPLSSVWFYVLYLFCALTDMIDGTVARRTGTVGSFGAKLDTVADFVFMLVCGVRLLPCVYLPVWLWVWIGVIALMKILNVAFVLVRRKKVISIHSVFNKITGFALFLLPLSLTFTEATYSVAAVCVLATVAVVQEVYLIAKGKELL